MLSFVTVFFFIRVTIVSKKFAEEADQIEKWYGTKYKVTKFSQEQISVRSIHSIHEMWLSYIKICLKFSYEKNFKRF